MPDAAAGASEFTVRLTDGAGSSATRIYAIAVISASAVIRFGALSHIAAGGFWDTTITLINTSSVPIAVGVMVRADDGTPLSLPLKLTQQGTTQNTPNPAGALLNPNSSVVIATGVLANTVVGWADVMSSGPVSGFAIMRSTPPNDKPSEATVPLQTSFPSRVTLPYDNDGGYLMGVALVNLSSAATLISATVW